MHSCTILFFIYYTMQADFGRSNITFIRKELNLLLLNAPENCFVSLLHYIKLYLSSANPISRH